MATGGLYGSSGTGALIATTGSETSGLYGNSVNFGGTFFEWFIFQEAATAPSTPTGGSWNFTTNIGTPPTGWTVSPPVAPVYEIWVSIAIVNSKTPTTFTWSTPGLLGVVPSTTVGTTTTGAAGSSASVTNSGTSLDAVLNFTIPRGDTGATGATGTAATIAVGTTTTTNPGTSATVTNSGTSAAAVFNFGIPKGAGIITGGTAGQYLAKASGTDYDTVWSTITGTLAYQGAWNASTNSPTLTSSVGTNGYYYVVSVAGSTNLNGVTDWQIGDWAIFNGTIWQKLDQTNLVTSVAGRTGAVVLANTDISGLGTMSTQNANSVAITGGTISGLSSALPVASGGTGVIASSGANSVVLRDSSLNINANSISEGFSNVAAAGTTTVLTVASAPNYVVTGSGGQTYQLPDATTLANGANYIFNNNQSSGTIVVKNNSGTTVATIQSGGYVDVILLSNSIAAGSWDVHNFAPSNVSWSTNTFDYAGSFTSGTWNGVAVAVNRGGTGLSAGTSGGVPYFSSTSTIASSAALAANALVIGGGAGVAPSTVTTGTGVVTALGVNTGTAGAFVVNGGVLGTPSSGTVTNLTGTASININGTVGATTPAAGSFTSVTASTTLGVTGTTTLTGVATLTANPVLSAGTANGVTYLNGSKSLTSGSAITFDGTNFATTGTATATKLIPTGTSVTGNGLYLPAANALGLSTNGTNAVYIDSSQNVGIGTSSPSYKLNVVSTSSSGVSTGVFSNANNSLFIRNGGGTIVYLTSDSSVNNAWGMDSTSNYVAAYTGTGVERMRIDSSGNLLVGKSTTATTLQGCQIAPSGLINISRVTNDNAMAFYTAQTGANVGTISLTSSATAYNTSSDYRLKENIQPMQNALTTVSQLKPCTYKWKVDGSDGQGFIAHELQAIVPDCVTGEKDAVETYTDEDGNEQTRPKYQGIDVSFLVATLTAAIQELKALTDTQASTITALTARITALEAK